MSNSKIKVHILSDIHNEHMKYDKFEAFVERLKVQVDKDQPEIAIFAGDIGNLVNNELFTNRLMVMTDLYPHSFYVPGNHEYYNYSLARGDLDLIEVGKLFNKLTILNNADHVHNGVRYVGGTMWFDAHSTYNKESARYFNDFKAISYSRNSITDKHKDFINRIVSTIKTGDVVITHHLPFPESVAPQFKNDELNVYFLHDVSQNLPEGVVPRIWIHGHTHSPVDYITDTGIKVYANPKGYPREGTNTGFFDRLLITI